MSGPGPETVTRLLEAYSSGDRSAIDGLMAVVYDELRRIAHLRLRGERPDHTFHTTDLVHEVYLKLVDLDRMDWKNRAHFFAIASQAMRRVLINYAVQRNVQKRGGGFRQVPLEHVEPGEEMDVDGLLALNEALERLEKLDARQARVVECRFFGGLSIEETATALGISTATANRDWTMARAWLTRQLAS